MGDGTGIVMNDNQILELKGNLHHTSIYGVVSRGAFIWIDPPVTPTVQSAITLTGKIYRDYISADPHIYQSTSPQWSPSALEITSDLVLNEDGTWSLPIRLGDGDNYIYASIGNASISNYPTNSVLITKDAIPPVLSALSVSPEYVTAGTDAVKIQVTLSEPGEVYLSIPFLSEDVIYKKVETAPLQCSLYTSCQN